MSDLELYIRKGFGEAGLTLDDETVRRFLIYAEELLRWNRRVDLTAIRSEEDVAAVHFLTSAAFSLAEGFSPADETMDLGSGAGFPGLPLKILHPSLPLTLVESSSRKGAFLKHIVRALALEGVRCVTSHSRDLARREEYRGRFQQVVTRGAGRIGPLVKETWPFLGKEGRLITRKGSHHADELREAEEEMKKANMELSGVTPFHNPLTGETDYIVVLEKCST